MKLSFLFLWWRMLLNIVLWNLRPRCYYEFDMEWILFEMLFVVLLERQKW